jgi:hypothetical protein
MSSARPQILSELRVAEGFLEEPLLVPVGALVLCSRPRRARAPLGLPSFTPLAFAVPFGSHVLIRRKRILRPEPVRFLGNLFQEYRKASVYERVHLGLLAPA